tara:strand:- start:25134 stop:25712 length:579 start_codon:yes stop_codon:yes gene_type:complete
MPELGNNRTNQSGSQAGGHIAGRDIHIVNEQQHISPLRSLLARIDQAREDDPELNELIDQLQHFSNPAGDGPPIGLEKKLMDGNREELVRQATREKEMFAKLLAQNQLSYSAQKVYAYLLGSVRDRFKRYITPLLCDNATADQVDAAIVEHIVEPCVQDLEHNPLDISTTHIHGMVYFLTGNCYLLWTGRDV